MSDPLFNHGNAEQFKGFIHLGIFALASMCLGYNALAYGQRGERRLLTNTGVYALLLLYESTQIQRHLQEPTS
jgi:hypothetical protein